MPQCSECKHYEDGYCKAHPPVISATMPDRDGVFPHVDGTQEPCAEFKAGGEQ